jgi:hypothetical protein
MSECGMIFESVPSAVRQLADETLSKIVTPSEGV